MLVCADKYLRVVTLLKVSVYEASHVRGFMASSEARSRKPPTAAATWRERTQLLLLADRHSFNSPSRVNQSSCREMERYDFKDLDSFSKLTTTFDINRQVLKVIK